MSNFDRLNSFMYTRSVWTIEKLERIEKALGILPE
jgi:hypothetical protein